ncbi:hypothetical protein [Glutamicibacter sp.]|jgi:hypothetical protein|uniref:hypothetical protein n=1 Tax=Glutamicibacter sp. TaxID=1931995 RepID=UPI002FDAD947
MNCPACREPIFDLYVTLRKAGTDYREDADLPYCLPCFIGELKKQAPIIEERKKAKAASDEFFKQHMARFRASQIVPAPTPEKVPAPVKENNDGRPEI